MRCALAAIALAIAAFAPTAFAQAQEARAPADQYESHECTMRETGWRGGMAALMRAGGPDDLSPERVGARLAALHDELAITRAQERRWADLAQALRSDAIGMRALMNTERGSASSVSLPDRLRQRHVLMQQRLRALGRIEHAVGGLYAVLSASQRARAERALRALAC